MLSGYFTGFLTYQGLSSLTRNNWPFRAYSRLRVFGTKVLYDPQGDTIFRKEFSWLKDSVLCLLQ